MKLHNKNAQLFFPVTSGQNLADTTHLCIAAHQDDIELMAAGSIIECFGKKDKAFTGVVITDGAGSPRKGVYAGCSNEDMKIIRANEQNAAATLGRYNAQFQLYYSSGEVKDKNNPDITGEIAEIIKLTKPGTVLTHNLADKHDTHCAVALRTIWALRNLETEYKPKKIYSMEVWRSLDWMCDEEKTLFDTSYDEFLQQSLLGVYHSQIAGGKRYDLAGMGRRRANATYFASHDTDEIEAAEYALDITELIENKSLDPADFINKYIENFKNDVNNRIKKLI